ncbi:hypothetical protein Spla01_02374 [Streptomyces platensis]|uniref:Uncharacterized protein n=1 Tax=Streptomyces platensis TaxID=58346 RepID=A0ABX3Y7E7_STRPT|nr:hypothetical protein BG653_00386 [Streptomyces platensis]
MANALSPGPTDTGLLRAPTGRLDGAAAMTGLGRIGPPCLLPKGSEEKPQPTSGPGRGLSVFDAGRRCAWLPHVTLCREPCYGASIAADGLGTGAWATAVASSTAGCSPTGTW